MNCTSWVLLELLNLNISNLPILGEVHHHWIFESNKVYEEVSAFLSSSVCICMCTHVLMPLHVHVRVPWGVFTHLVNMQIIYWATTLLCQAVLGLGDSVLIQEMRDLPPYNLLYFERTQKKRVKCKAR